MEAAQPQACGGQREEEQGTIGSFGRFEKREELTVSALEASRSVESPQYLSSGLSLALTTARHLLPMTLGNSHSGSGKEAEVQKG